MDGAVKLEGGVFTVSATLWCMPDLQLTSPERIREAVERMRPLKGAVIPPEIANRLGATHYAGRYSLTDEPFILEGLGMLHGMGFRTVKLWFGWDLPGYDYHSDWKLAKNARLIDVAKHEYFRKAFASPFSTFVLEVAPVAHGPGKLQKVEDFAAETEQFEEVALHLLTTHGDQPITFILQHWEGDWMLRGKDKDIWQPGKVPADAAARVASFAAWLGARQKGVENARRRAGKTECRVLHAAEANRVLDSLKGVPTFAKDVLPQVALDLVSWSAYDGVNAKDAVVATWHGLEILRHYMKPSAAGIKNAIYIGEVGLPENGKKPEEVNRFWDDALAVFLANEIPWIIQWQLYCNEPKAVEDRSDRKPLAAEKLRGFWLIKPDGTPGYTGELFQNLLNSAGTKMQL